MRYIFARYLRNIDQIIPLIRDKNSGLTVQAAIKWKAPQVWKHNILINFN
jgi:hypothetical protein